MVGTAVRSASREVVIGHDQPFCIIGERINPTGRKRFQEQLRAGDLSHIEIDVAEQVAGGADVLDVNMGVPLTDEADLLARAIKLVQSLTDLPICIDSSVVDALDAGLEVYEGKALVNSVTGEDDRLETILPLVKRFDAAVIALALRIHREPSSVTDEHIVALRDHGYRDREIADVVGIVALNTLTGGFNLLAGLTPGSDTGV